MRPGARRRAEGTPGEHPIRHDSANSKSLQANWRPVSSRCVLLLVAAVIVVDVALHGGDSPPCSDCLVDALACDTTVRGSLSENDCTRLDGKHIDIYTVEVPEQGRVTLSMRSATIDPFVALFDDSCQLVDTNDDCVGTLNSCLVVDLPAGTYHVGATSFDAGERGSYELELTCQPGFEFCVDCVIEPMVCGESRTVAFPRNGCVDPFIGVTDLYQFEIETTGPVRVSATAMMEPVNVAFHDATCEFLAVGTIQYDPSSRLFVSRLDLPEVLAGTYFVGLEGPATPQEVAVEIECPDVSACRDCSVGRLDCGKTVAGLLDDKDCQRDEEGSTEVWTVELFEPLNVSLTARSEAFDPVIRLLNGFCEITTESQPCDATEGGACLEEVALAPGIHYFAVQGLSSEAAGPYTLNMECAAFDPCRDCTLGQIHCEETVEASGREVGCLLNLPLGDLPLSTWSFRLDERRRVSLQMTSPESTPFHLFDANCFEIAFSEEFFKEPDNVARIVGDFPAGEYFVLPDLLALGDGSYSLAMTCSAPITCTDCVRGPIGCGETVVAALSGTDCVQADSRRFDVYQLDVIEDRSVDIHLRSDAFDALLTLFDASCQTIAVNDDCVDLNSCLNVDLTAGTYFIGVSHYFSQDFGQYVLSIDGEGCPSCSACGKQRIEAGQSVQGELGESSCAQLGGMPADVWDLTVDQATPTTVTVESDAFDPILSIRDGDCQELERNDDCDLLTLSSCLTLTLDPGDYLIAVSAFLPDSSGRYRLSMSSEDGLALPGDCDSDQELAISDGICLIEALFLRADRELPCGNGRVTHPANEQLTDFDGNQRVDITDVVSLYNFLFLGGPRHSLGNSCATIVGCNEVCAE